MKIGIIAPPWVPVPPPAYGGTEAVVDRLARGLSDAGHHVTLCTIGESTCPVDKVWRFDTAREPIGDSVLEAAHVLSAYDALRRVDLVHDHTMIGPLLARRRRRRPVVATVHAPFTPDVRRIYRTASRSVRLVCVSRDQRAAAPEIPVTRVVHHGIDVEDFPVGLGDGGYLLFLGRMSPDKGADRAVAVARATGSPLLIAAKMREPAEIGYFEERVQPLLGGNVEFLGEVARPRRLELLQGARALINPIQWAEPFGLVMIEAMACGTPVVAQPFGAAPEIVVDGVTGYLRSDVDGMASAVEQLDQIDRGACREAAIRRFSTDRMVRDYLAVYQTVLGEARSRLPDLDALGTAS